MSFAKPFFGGSPTVGMQSSEDFSERQEREAIPIKSGEVNFEETIGKRKEKRHGKDP